VASTLANLVLFLLFRTVLGPIWANVAALLLTTIANTAANRRLTFGVRGRQDAARHQFQGLLVFGLGLGLTTGALALLAALAPGAHQSVEVATIVVANLVATVLRFVLFRAWVFRSRTRTAATAPAEVPSEIAA
jgi:putative flippase GtrA